MKPRLVLALFTLCCVVLAGCATAPSVDSAGRPLIRKLGTIDLDLVETTPVVFKGRAYRFEWVREKYVGNQLGDHFRFIDQQTGKASEPFAAGYRFGSAFVEGDKVFVTGTAKSVNGFAGGSAVTMFASRDLKQWEVWPALELPGWEIFNTSICRADDEYVLMFEIRLPKEQAGAPFTARFARSRDLRHWTLTPPECVYAKDRYTAPHALRYVDGWYYVFYLEAHSKPTRSYDMRVVRSRNLVHWEASPLNPVIAHSADDQRIANPSLTAAQRARIQEAVNLNNSDIDFCEHKGRLLITYSWGNQLGNEFLAEAIYDGTLKQFLRGWFPNRPE